LIVRTFKASRFRCLKDVELEFDPQYNLIYGQNASGKTSLLEALAYLGRGKSFRGAPRQAVVAHGERDFVVFGRVREGGREVSVGIRNGADSLEIRIDGESAKGVADLAALVPLQVIDPEVHSLVAGGPEERRRFLDWIVFHVEHEYLATWRRFRRVLKQRNVLLKQGGPSKVLDSWDDEFVALAGEVDQYRRRVLEEALPVLEDKAGALLDDAVGLSYQSGWKAGTELVDAVAAARARDTQLGSSQVGPHRAELKIVANERQARRLVSRGQQKLLASALILGASDVVQTATGRPLLLLMDDPAAELDRVSLGRIMAGALDLGTQIVMTSLEPDLVEFPSTPRMFHVEHGRIVQVS
jgi:DNA replication and repair protein RecF